jgi:hypothetical protein
MTFVCKHVALYVPDLRSAEAFYREALARAPLAREPPGAGSADALRQTTYSSAIASVSSRMAMPSSTSSRVIVNGGTTMITFQCVIR